MATSYPRPELLASVDWLAENMDRPGIRIVDCRWRPDGTARELFVAGHIEGATHLDWSSDLVDPDDPIPYQLAGPEAVSAAASRAGLGDGMTAVLYDDSAALYAARVWWCLRAYGFTSTRILDGGYRAWLGGDRPVVSGQPTAMNAVFTPRADQRVRIGVTDLRALLAPERVTMIDARSPAEYRGQEGNEQRLGHVPGARNLPASLLTVPGSGEFRPADEIDRLVAGAGVARGPRIVVYDGAGVGAAKTAFVLALLGFDDIAVYDGGWAEWGNRSDLPVER